MNANCNDQFGNSDITGIGVRIGYYITIIEILFFYIVADHSSSNLAIGQVAILIGLIHLINISFMLKGQFDQYTLTVMIHQALLVNGPQIIHLFKFQRRSWHRFFYVNNMILTLAEFYVSLQWPSWINRNGNFCAELTDAIDATQGERAMWTLCPLFLNFALSVIDVIVNTIDKYRNRHVDRKKGDHSRPTIPRSFLWGKKHWEWKRIVYCTIGMTCFLFSIFVVEFCIMGHFHKNVQNIKGISSSEDGWSYGQLVPAIMGSCLFLIILRGYLIQKLLPYAREEKAMKESYNQFSNQSESWKTWLFSRIYRMLTSRSPRPTRKKSQTTGDSQSSTLDGSSQQSDTPSTTALVRNVDDHNAYLVGRMNTGSRVDVELEYISSRRGF